jgi:hypothetical protein
MTAGSASHDASDLYSLITDVIAGQDCSVDGVTLRGIVRVKQPHDKAALMELERAVSEVARVIATGEVYGTLNSGEARILTEKLAERAGFKKQLVYALVTKWAKDARAHRKKAQAPSVEDDPNPLSVVLEQVELWQGEGVGAPIPCVSVYCTPSCPGGGNVRHYKLSDRAFHLWVRAHVKERLGEVLLKEQVDEVVETLAALAMLPDRPVHKRCKRIGGANCGPVWINLANEDLTVIKITADKFEVVPQTVDTPKFMTMPHYLRALPNPIPPENGQTDYAEALGSLLNLPVEPGRRKLSGSRGRRKALMAAIRAQRRRSMLMAATFSAVAAKPEGNFFHLHIGGEQGAAKTTAGRIVKNVLDPSTIDTMIAPKSVHDMAVVAAQGHIALFDNLSFVGERMSDVLCVMATRGSAPNRKLYTDDEVASLSLGAPAIITSIPDVIGRGDLHDRTLPIHLAPPVRRLFDEEVDERFAEAHPGLLYLICRGISSAIRNCRHVQATLDRARVPRMASEFAWAAAAGHAWGWKPGELFEAFAHTAVDNARVALDGSPTMLLLTEVVEDAHGTLRKMAQAILATIENKIATNIADSKGTRPRDMPASPRALAGMLTRYAGSFRALGWTFESDRVGRGADRATQWLIETPHARKQRLAQEADAARVRADAGERMLDLSAAGQRKAVRTLLKSFGIAKLADLEDRQVVAFAEQLFAIPMRDGQGTGSASS